MTVTVPASRLTVTTRVSSGESAMADPREGPAAVLAHNGPAPPVPLVLVTELEALVVAAAPPDPPAPPVPAEDVVSPPVDVLDVEVVLVVLSPPQPAAAEAAPTAVRAASIPMLRMIRRWPGDPLIPRSRMSILLRNEAIQCQAATAPGPRLRR
jgi:hypothetical protein